MTLHASITQNSRSQSIRNESDLEDEVTVQPSRTPSPSPPPTDDELDAAVAALISATKTLSIAGSNAAPATTPQRPSLKEEIVTKKCPMLLLGESESRALSFAFGVMRGSLDGIRATCFHHSASTSACSWLDCPPLNTDTAIDHARTRIDSNKTDRYGLERDGV